MSHTLAVSMHYLCIHCQGVSIYHVNRIIRIPSYVSSHILGQSQSNTSALIAKVWGGYGG